MEDYLQPSFKPQDATRTKLRNILSSKGIEWREAHKHAKLVELFNNQLVPRIPSYLAEASAEPSSEGIEWAQVHRKTFGDCDEQLALTLEDVINQLIVTLKDSRNNIRNIRKRHQNMISSP